MADMITADMKVEDPASSVAKWNNPRHPLQSMRGMQSGEASAIAAQDAQVAG